MKIVRTVLICMLLLGCGPALTVDLTIDIGSGKTRTTFGGYNTNMISGVFGYTDELLVEAARPLQPAWLRFPGGTVANFYSWEKQGFDIETAGSSASDKLNARNQRNVALLESRRNGEIRLIDFLGFAEKTGASAEFVLNVFSADVATTQAWAATVSDMDIDVLAWELGNELYLPQYRDRFETADAYVDQARSHALALRSELPDANILVPVHAVGYHLYPSSRYANRWNETIAKHDFYDGVAVHLYFHMDKYFKPKDFEREREHSFEMLMAETHRSVASAEKYYADLYGGRSIWATEWNLIDRELDVVGTPMHALWVGDFLIQLLDWDGPLLASGFNTLAGRWNGFPVIVPWRKRNDGTAWSTRTMPSYVPLQLINSSLGDSSVVYEVALDEAQSIDGDVPGLIATAYSNESGLFLAISNRTGAEQLVRVSLSEGDPVTGLSVKSFDGGQNLDRTELLPSDTREVRIKGNTLTMSAYSFAVVSVE